MTVELSDPLAAAAKLTPDEVRLRIAFSLYSQGRLSTRQSAELAGLTRHAFMDELAKHRIEAPYRLEDWQADLATLRELGER
jgi:predicted HTH domain antitoxin